MVRLATLSGPDAARLLDPVREGAPRVAPEVSFDVWGSLGGWDFLMSEVPLYEALGQLGQDEPALG